MRKKYKSVSEIYGKPVVGLVDVVGKHQFDKDTQYEEYFQLAYIMLEMEGKSVVDVAHMMHKPLTWVSNLIQSPIYKAMQEGGWTPMYKCMDAAIRKSIMGFAEPTSVGTSIGAASTKRYLPCGGDRQFGRDYDPEVDDQIY